MAEEKGNLQLLHKVWERAKEVLKTEELNNKLFLGKGIRERTVWHRAEEKDKLEELENCGSGLRRE